ncbi:Xaa-Pro dipeptidase [Leucothrix sargassi]|nr:Xaa-Pro dipeptidase [Leucothrix sargassi]
MASLYEQHLSTLQQRSERALEQCGSDYLLIASGHTERQFLDDYHFPFKPNPHFAQWVPLSDKQNCWILVRPNQKPALFFYQPSDFWHLIEPLPEAEWTHCFDVTVFDDNKILDAELSTLTGNGAVISPPKAGEGFWGCQLNPSELLNHLHFERAYKTEWEQQNLRQANQIAVLGHEAAREAFFAGKSEYQIHQAYLSATQQCEKHLPYGNIVALNDHGAVLHYQYQSTQPPLKLKPLSLLIDAGATYQGYAADITRTWTHEETLFSDMVYAVDQAQLSLIAEIQDGVGYVALHDRMRLKLARILTDFGVVTLDAEAQLETGIIGTFFPHGLGHLLGLQVHDIGGFQQDTSGQTQAAPAHSPALRLTRTLATDMVITIEPGLYFIDSLLSELSNSPQAKYIDWTLLDELRPYGGIRIEDNVLVTSQGSENFTRDAFAKIETV